MADPEAKPARQPKLAWVWEAANGCWRTFVAGAQLTVFENLDLTGVSSLAYSQHKSATWAMCPQIPLLRTGAEPTLVAAQCAAEDSALEWLTEGVKVFGGRVVLDL